VLCEGVDLHQHSRGSAMTTPLRTHSFSSHVSGKKKKLNYLGVTHLMIRAPESGKGRHIRYINEICEVSEPQFCPCMRKNRAPLAFGRAARLFPHVFFLRSTEHTPCDETQHSARARHARREFKSSQVPTLHTNTKYNPPLRFAVPFIAWCG
jgi:hypothetical protein